MKKQQITYLKIFAASIIFVLSVLSYNTALSSEVNSGCFICVCSGGCWCSSFTEGGYNGCSTTNGGCDPFGGSCACEPTDPCES